MTRQKRSDVYESRRTVPTAPNAKIRVILRDVYKHTKLTWIKREPHSLHYIERAVNQGYIDLIAAPVVGRRGPASTTKFQYTITLTPKGREVVRAERVSGVKENGLPVPLFTAFL